MPASIRTRSGGAARAAALLALTLLAAGCASATAHRNGVAAGKKGDWDTAVAHLTKATLAKPDNVGYRIDLENARVEASRLHRENGLKHLAASEWDQAVQQLEIATNFDPSNKTAAADLAEARERLAEAEAQKNRLADFDALKSRADAATPVVPVLSARSPVPISLKFNDQSLETIFKTLSKLSAVNILLDSDYRDKKVSVDMTGITFEQALDQLTFVNRLFYAVLDPNTLIIVPDTPAKRRTYEQVLMRTFYVQNADLKEVETVLKTTLGNGPKIASNPTLGAITIVGTPDEMALAARILAANDKSRGEVMIEVQILEVNRTRAREYGLKLSTYSAGLTFSPTGSADEAATAGYTTVRAYLLSSLNLADFLVSVPRSVLLNFMQNESNARILAAPRLRASEGKKTSLQIGSEIPVPVTTFQATNTGGGTFTPATSFQYRNVGVNLDITPRVNASGEILLEMAAEFSLQGPDSTTGGQVLPTFLTRKVNGILRLHDGETNLIGGLLSTQESQSVATIFGMPSFLSKILGNSTPQKRDTEILISITPHLVRAPRVTEADLTSVSVGTRETVKVPGARPPLFGPEAGVPPASPAPAASPVPAGPAPAASPAGPGPSAHGVPRPPGGPGNGPRPSPPSEAPSVPPPALEPSPAAAPTEPAAPAAQEGPSGPAVLLSPASGSVAAGQVTTFSVVVREAVNLAEIEVVLSFDPAVAEGVDASPGPLLTLDGSAVAAQRQIEAGRFRVQFGRTTGVSGSGVVATLSLRGLRAGTTPVSAELVRLGSRPGGDLTLAATPVRLEVTP